MYLLHNQLYFDEIFIIFSKCKYIGENGSYKFNSLKAHMGNHILGNNLIHCQLKILSSVRGI